MASSTDRTRSNAGSTPRVLWVADKLGYGDRLHGLGAYYKQVVPALPTGSVIPAVLRSTDGIAGQLRDAGVELLRLEMGKMDPRTLIGLVGLIRREGVDVLHLHGYGASTFGRVAARLAGKPALIHQHDSIMHAPWYGRLCDRLLAPWTRRALAVSDDVAGYCATQRHVRNDRVEVLVNAVARPQPLPDAELANWREGQGIGAGDPLVGTLTRLREEKGIRFLIEAWPGVVAELPQARLLIFGDGEEREMLERRSAELGVAGQVHFLGFDPQGPRFLEALDCFVLPSLHEGLPFALMEALAAERPAVVSAVGGMAELLRDGDDALLVPAGQPEPLAQALVRVLREPELRATLRQGARRTSARFSLDRHVERLVAIYEEVAA